MTQPETRYTTVGNDRVAYQVFGEGPRDLVYTTGLFGHVDMQWEDPGSARVMRRLAMFARLIRFDRRGSGLSDRPSDGASSVAEQWVEDCAAVLDAAGSTSAVLLGSGTQDAGPLILHFMDRHPQRCSGLIFANTTACWAARPDYPQGLTPEAIEEIKEIFNKTWGRPEFAAQYTPSEAKNPSFLNWFAKYQRSVASPRTMVENLEQATRLDCRHLLERVRVPTLVFGRSERKFIPLAQSAYIARHVADARFVTLPGSDGNLTGESSDQILDLIEQFVTGKRHGTTAERALAAVLFTDIVGSTQRAAELGDAGWRRLLELHDRVIGEQVATFRGKVVDRSGDGALSTFASPDHAIDCALALQAPMAELGLPIRSGVHFGQLELRGADGVGGIGVHIGARVMSMATAGEILLSHTAHGVLAGSRYGFEERGIHELKGVPGRWMIFAVSPQAIA
jgi:class 3 adenylate cyclase